MTEFAKGGREVPKTRHGAGVHPDGVVVALNAADKYHLHRWGHMKSTRSVKLVIRTVFFCSNFWSPDPQKDLVISAEAVVWRREDDLDVASLAVAHTLAVQLDANDLRVSRRGVPGEDHGGLPLLEPDGRHTAPALQALAKGGHHSDPRIFE